MFFAMSVQSAVERGHMFKHILIPMDSTERSEKAAKQGVRLAKALAARVTAFHLMPTFRTVDFLNMSRTQFREAATARGDAILRFAQEVAHEADVPFEKKPAAGDDPFTAIAALAERTNCDLIVMASHGRRGIEGVLL
jgi:nucleotide-binding universal stress UspA family protein